jgi:putative heme-binding domain-containing protein
MYREVIEHPWSIPDEIKKHLDLNSGNDRGRIYRLVPDAPEWSRRRQVTLGKATIDELVKTLAHPNGWHRDTASRLLYERQDQAAVPLLEKLLRESDSSLARLHTLGVLAGLGALREETIAHALSDQDAHVRERAIALAPSTPAMADRLVTLVGDPSIRVRFQLALTLGNLEAAKSAAALAELAKENVTDPWIRAAVLSAPPAHAQMIFDRLKATSFLQSPEATAFTTSLIQINAASGDAARRQEIISFVATVPRAPFVRALGDGLRRAGVTIEKADAGHQLAPAIALAAKAATDEKEAIPARIGAIELLGLVSPEQTRSALTACLAKGQPDAVQSAAIQALAQRPFAEATRAMLDHWPNLAAPAKTIALSAVVAREESAGALLEAIQSGTIPPSELPVAQVQSLVQHKNTQLAALARKALAAVIPPSRAEMVAKFQPAIAAKGDATRGQAIYQARCFTCHRAAGLGVAVGPDLITVKTKGREALLTAILEPHKEVASQYIAYTVSTKDGQTLAGVIARDDANSVTLRMPGGAEVTIPRADIKGTTSAGQSLMPEGLEAGLDVAGMADLLTFIEELP